ncbi:MAG: hypothetical protein ABR969_00225 [Sedimentisphaerales bacterium]|jgi:hypothetical protein
METKKLYLLFLTTILFLSSCTSIGRRKDDFSFLPEIIKMKPVKITTAIFWVMPLPKNREEFLKSVDDPNCWKTLIVLSDVSQIREIITALEKTPFEAGSGVDTITTGYKLSFEDKSGKIKWTTALLSHEEEKVYFPDRIYGKEFYDVFQKYLKIGLPQEKRQEN